MKQEVVDFAQLWFEEQQLLTEISTSVPANGTIVEIGTAQGGSALIFHRACGHKGVQIYSFDIAPSDKAYEHLRDTNVKIIAQSSKEGALGWMKTVGKPIDLLFIDGGHTVQDVFEDFNSWVPHLRPGGTIVFHDYDRPERGGLAHPVQRICLDAIMQSGFLNHQTHQYRTLYGTVEKPEEVRLSEKACYQAFSDMGCRIVRLRDTNYSGWIIVDDGQFTRVLRGLQPEHIDEPISPGQASDPNKKYLVSARPLDAALDTLQQRGIPGDSIVAVDSLSACYIVEHALKTNRDYVAGLTSLQDEFLHWEEMLFMFEHAFGASQFPDRMPDTSVESDVTKLSRLVAREKVRLSILSCILKTFVSWRP